MFLLVSGCHAGAHPDGLQLRAPAWRLHTFLYKQFSAAVIDLNLGESLFILSTFFSQFLHVIYWRVLIFISIDFEWPDTENQQYAITS